MEEFFDRTGMPDRCKPWAELYHLINADMYETPGDRDLYLDLACRVEGPVLEIAVGTGRVATYLADRGIEVVGIDASDHMLEVCRQNITEFCLGVQGRIVIEKADMRDFNLGRKFKLAIIPFSAFQVLLCQKDQNKTLQCIRKHLKKRGVLVIDVFDPRYDLCSLSNGFVPKVFPPMVHPTTRRTWDLRIASRKNIPERQAFQEEWIFTELDESGNEVSRQADTLEMRWASRFEMELLLLRNGFDVLYLWGDYQKNPCGYGNRQVWVLQKR